MSLVDDPDGLQLFAFEGTVLDDALMEGPAGPNQWTYKWTRGVVSLNATAATNGRISVVWDLVQSPYGVFDNIVITASDDPFVVS